MVGFGEGEAMLGCVGVERSEMVVGLGAFRAGFGLGGVRRTFHVERVSLGARRGWIGSQSRRMAGMGSVMGG